MNTALRYCTGILLVLTSVIIAGIEPLVAILPYAAGMAVLVYLLRDLLRKE
jgi:hypothetical protein